MVNATACQKTMKKEQGPIIRSSINRIVGVSESASRLERIKNMFHEGGDLRVTFPSLSDDKI